MSLRRSKSGPCQDGTQLEVAQRMATFPEHEIGIATSERLAADVVRIYERAQSETLALLQSLPVEKVVIPVQEWMTASQLAEYWQLYNEKNEPTTAGILKWSKRPADQYHCHMLTWVICSDSIE